MKLYIQELPAPRLYLSVPEALPLVLKSGPPAPELYLEKAKYTRREGSPGSYKYYYDRASDAQKPFIPEEQFGFEFNEVATEKQITAALNKIPGVHDKDFLTLSEELEQQGIAADTKMIGDAFDSGNVKGPSEEAGPSIPGMEGPFNFPGGHKLYYDPSEEGGKYYNREQDRYLDHEEGWRATTGNKKSLDPLYLDLNKGCAKEPVQGQFMSGGGGKAYGAGQTSLEDEMKDLMDVLPGADVEKAAYTKRTGSPGNYKYEYGTGDSGGDQGKKDEESKKQSGVLSAIGDYFKPLTQASSYKQVPGEIAGAARAAGRYLTGKE
jgi:hypothetical protein